MDEHKKVRVTMNQNSSDDKKHDLEYFLTPKSQKGNSHSLTFRGRSMFAKMVKPIMLAILLGVIFGAGLMYFFSDLTPDAVPVTSMDDEDNSDSEGTPNKGDSNGGSTLNIPGKTRDVIQFGVFSSEANANELIQKTLAPISLPATVQEQNGQYYVISHLLFSEQDKDAITQWLESQGLVYMTDFLYKSWSFKSVNVNVNDSEKKWLENGLKIIESYQSASKENWVNETRKWVNNAPESYQGKDKLNQVTQLLNDLQTTSNQTLKGFYYNSVLLNIHLFFSKIA